jgi:hypothetical protein
MGREYLGRWGDCTCLEEQAQLVQGIPQHSGGAQGASLFLVPVLAAMGAHGMGRQLFYLRGALISLK